MRGKKRASSLLPHSVVSEAVRVAHFLWECDGVQLGKPVYLASTSPRRTQLLTQVGIAHTVIAPDGDESVAPELTPAQVVKTLAHRKAHSVRASISHGLIIGADTIVYLDGRIMGKPGDPQQAFRMLQHLSGREHEVYSSVAVIDVESGQCRYGVQRVVVQFRPLSDAEIKAYVATGEPLDKAGSYSIQGRGALFVQGIQGDYYAVVGLPLCLTAELLKELA